MAGAGALDRRITIRRATTTTNAFNEAVPAFADFCELWAARRDISGVRTRAARNLSDGEKLAAGQVGAVLSARFLVRSSNETRTVTALDRIVHDGATWKITGAKEADLGRGRYIEISAVKDSD